MISKHVLFDRCKCGRMLAPVFLVFSQYPCRRSSFVLSAGWVVRYAIHMQILANIQRKKEAKKASKDERTKS